MLIVGNWKAYVESGKTAQALVASAKKLTGLGHDIVLAPSAPYLGLLAVGNKAKVAYSAQDISDSTGGAHTGETTGAQLRDLGVSYTILGHSERRACGETDEVVLSKTKHALAQGLTPIICIGEKERDADAHYLAYLRGQIAHIFAPLSQQERMQLVLAYEPIWAIGKTEDEAITPQDLREMILYIRKALGEYLPGRAPESVKILYGGSVEEGNAKMLADATGIDGFLVGHASADAKAFTGIVKAIS